MLEDEIKNISEEAVEEASRQLQCRLKRNYGKNEEKFHLYSARNIFSSAEPLESLSLEERPCEIMRVSDSQIGNQLSQLVPMLEDMQQTCNEVHKLRREMLDASFNVRMRIQAIEDSGVHPMADVVENLFVEIQKLNHLLHRLNGIVDRDQTNDKHVQGEEVMSESLNEDIDAIGPTDDQQLDRPTPTDRIETGDLDDLRLVSRAVQQRM